MKITNKILSALLFCAFLRICPYAAENPALYDGYTINKVTVLSKRTKPELLKKYFALKEGGTFDSALYETAKNELHDLRISKKLSFSLQPLEDNALDISINADDGYYIFPLAFATGGEKSAAGIALAAGNLFKRGETIMIFGGMGKDGSILSFLLKDGRNTFSAAAKNMNFEQRFYQGNWINNDGIFSTSDDKEAFSDPIAQIYTKEDSFSLQYAREYGPFKAFIAPKYRYIRYDKDLVSGNYNALAFGLAYKRNIRSGANMGALFGYGLTDKEESLKDLPKPIYGFSAQLSYENGGPWTGADFEISKLSASAQSLTELRNRHLLALQIRGESAFNSPFAAQVRAQDLLGGQGRYSRTLFGRYGAGASASFTYYLLRNNIGLLSLQPFYEIAYIYYGGYRHQSGTGASISYKFWRFPFPFGLNYTYNLSDSSSQVSFVFGAKF